MGEPESFLVPAGDMEKILEDRLRWKAYAKAWEVQRLGKVLDGIAEVTSG